MSDDLKMGGMTESSPEPLKVWCEECSGTGRAFLSHVCDPPDMVCYVCDGTGRKDNPRLTK